MNMILNILKTIAMKMYIFFLNRSRTISIDYRSKIPITKLSQVISVKNVNYPIKIRNTSFQSLKISYGSKLFDCILIGKVIIGRFVSIAGPSTKIVGNINGIEIRSFTSIGSNVIIQETSHKYENASTYFINRHIIKDNNYNDEYSKGKIVIEEDCWIGSNSIILPGVIIGRGAIVGSGSVVTKSVPKYSIVGGNPAKIIRMRFNKKQIDYLENLEWWEWDVKTILNNKNIFLNSLKTE
jgi:acetyltransferase-like isoleucine patch superfamily enzyme